MKSLNTNQLPLVIFAGGMGTRMQEETTTKPKPMVTIGGEPLIRIIIRSYGKYGVSKFYILSGYKGEVFAEYFSAISFTQKAEIINGVDVVTFTFFENDQRFEIHLVDTGIQTPTAGRLLKIENVLKEDYFFCTYGDALANIDIKFQLETFNSSDVQFLVSAAKQRSRFGELSFDSDSKILRKFEEKPLMQNLVNIGYFIFNREIFKYCIEGEMLESCAMKILAQKANCLVYEHSGYWQPIDTLRELLEVNEMYNNALTPWENT